MRNRAAYRLQTRKRNVTVHIARGKLVIYGDERKLVQNSAAFLLANLHVRGKYHDFTIRRDCSAHIRKDLEVL